MMYDLHDLVFTSASKLVGDVRIGGYLGYSDHVIVQFMLLRDARQTK